MVVVFIVVVADIVDFVVVVDPRIRSLKFGQYLVVNSLYIADIEFLWWWVVSKVIFKSNRGNVR